MLRARDKTMKCRQALYLVCALAAAGASIASASAQEAAANASELTLRYELTLQPSPTSQPVDVPYTVPGFADEKLSLAPSNEQLLATEPLVDPKLPRVKSPDGVEAFSVQDVTAVEYRTGAGIGLGMATNGNWCISQSFVLGRDFDIALFFLDGADTHGKTPDVRTQDIGRTIGLRLNWKF
jgi:hypothetical protein